MISHAESAKPNTHRTARMLSSDQDTAKNRAEKIRRLFAHEAHAAGILGVMVAGHPDRCTKIAFLRPAVNIVIAWLRMPTLRSGAHFVCSGGRQLHKESHVGWQQAPSQHRTTHTRSNWNASTGRKRNSVAKAFQSSWRGTMQIQSVFVLYGRC